MSDRERALLQFDMFASVRPTCGCTPADTPELRRRFESALGASGPVEALLSAFREAGAAESFVVQMVLARIVAAFLDHATPHDGKMTPAGYCEGISASKLRSRIADLAAILDAMEKDGIGPVAGEDPRAAVEGALDELRVRLEQTQHVERVERDRQRGRGAPTRPLVSLTYDLHRWIQSLGVSAGESHRLLADLLTGLDRATTPERVRLSIKNRRSKRTGANSQKS